MNHAPLAQGRRLRTVGGLLAIGLLVVSAAAAVRFAPATSRRRAAVADGSLASARDRMLARLDKKMAKQARRAKAFDQPAEALAFYWSKRSPDGTAVEVSELEEAAAEAERLPLHSSGIGHQTDVPLEPSAETASTSGTLGSAWTPLGPGNIGGRSRALLIHRTQNNLMWTAGVAGGIWKSTNGGASWKPKGDLLVNIAVNSLIEDPIQDEVLYAGTGEGFFNGDAVRGGGIFKSTDYGETWAQLPATNTPDFHYVQKLAATRHKKKQRIYAATRTGLFRSTDAGATWTKVLDATAVRGCMDLAIQFHQDDKQNYVFASCGTYAQATVWRALDVEEGQTWEPVLREANMARTSLAIAPSNPSVIYAASAYYNPANTADPQTHGLRAIYRSTASGAAGTWETRVDYTNANKLNTVQFTNPVYAFLKDCEYGTQNSFLKQGWYDNQIAVDPKDENVVWTAGVDLMRSDDGGQNWGVASYWWFPSDYPNYAHADQHALTFHPKYNGDSNRQLFVGSDGGVHRTNDARAAVGTTLASVCGEPSDDQVRWTSLNNGYQVTQFYHGAVYPDGSRFFGGTQDNGTIRGSLVDGQNWTEISGGDGGYVAVDPTNTEILYSEFTAKSLQRSADGGKTWKPIHAGVMEVAGNFQFIHPYAMDPTNPARLWYGGATVWRTDNSGTNWSRASQFLGARIASWAVSKVDPNRVYVGVQHVGTTTSGRVFTTHTATTATSATVWTSAQPRQGYVSSVAIDPINPLVAYATYSTYDFGLHVGHVFKTTNGGASWTRIDLTLPDMPVHSVVVHPTRPEVLYIGTDLGVFVTVDGGGSWMRENTGFANVVTEHLEINNGRLFAFTHGRSAWSVPLVP